MEIGQVRIMCDPHTAREPTAVARHWYTCELVPGWSKGITELVSMSFHCDDKTMLNINYFNYSLTIIKYSTNNNLLPILYRIRTV